MSDPRYFEYLEVDSDFWQLEYLGRKVNAQYEALFDHNGYYPSDDYGKYPEYEDKGIIINLKLDVADGVVTGISYYKKVDRGIYYKGDTWKPLNAHDIKVFREVLDICTISRASAILDSLLSMPIKEGWVIKRVSEKSISFSNGNKSISLPIDYAKTIIDIARNAPDIRDNEEFWEINNKHLRGKYKEALFALLCNYDNEHFPEIVFEETVKERIDREDQEEATKKELISAINKNQIDTALELTEPFSDIPGYAIQSAIKSKSTGLLLSFLSKINNTYELEQVGEFAIATGETELLKGIAKKDNEGTNGLAYFAYKRQRIDYVLLLLEMGYILHIEPDDETCYKPEELLLLVDNPRISFSPKQLEQLYEEYGNEPIKRIIDNYCFRPYGLNEENAGYSSDETSAFVAWLLEKKDTELIDLAAEKGVKARIDSYSKEEDLAAKLFNEGGELWERGKELFSGSISYSKCLQQKDMALLQYLVKQVSVTESVLRRAIRDSAPEDMVSVLVQHLDLSIEEERRSDEFELWYYALKIKDLRTFEEIFNKINDRLDDEERQKIHSHFVWYEHDVEKAKALVKSCHLSDEIIKESGLASILPQGQALSLVEDDYFKDKERKETIYPQKVTFRCYDEHTWEIKGLPSRNQYDTPDVENLHYLVSVDGEVHMVKSPGQ